MSQNAINWYASVESDDADDIKLDFAVALERALDASGKKRIDLARILGVAPSRITTIFSGDANLTMEMMHRVADAVDHKVSIHLSPKSANGRWTSVFTSANTNTVNSTFKTVQIINPDLKLAA